MRKILRRVMLIASAFVALVGATASAVLAHQPYFEEDDLTLSNPLSIADPAISVALYATLESATDVDFFTFFGAEGDTVLIGMSIPQLEGQADFAPDVALFGGGFDGPTEKELPADLEPLLDAGLTPLVLDRPQKATSFFEPFSRTSYWQRQEQRVTLPRSGSYVIAVWHPQGVRGRYTLVVGEREVWGGDPGFRSKMRAFWTPVEGNEAGPSEDDLRQSPRPPCSAIQRLQMRLLNRYIDCQT